jgi:toxin YoeB
VRRNNPARIHSPGVEWSSWRIFSTTWEYWAATDAAVHRRLLRIMRETVREPFVGIGKPELLKHQFQGSWSRRLTDEDRVVYRVKPEFIDFLSARYHYPRRL